MAQDPWQEAAREWKQNQGKQAMQQPASAPVSTSSDADWKIWQQGAGGTGAQTNVSAHPLLDLGVGAAKGLTSTFTAVPALIGNALNEALGYQKPQRVIDQENYLEPANTYQKIGKYVEQAAEALLPIGLGIKAMPTEAKAGKLFDEVMQAAKGQPVNLTRSSAPLDRIAQLTDAGGPTLSAPNKLLLRKNTINPIPYEEARDFYSNISSLSAADKQIANRPMLRELKNLREAFKQDIGDTAEAVGKRQQYEDAMRIYRKANQIKSGAKAAAKVGGGMALGGTVLWPILKQLLK
jgi:hypothetical protein